jgi:hypothetical protein
VTSGGGNVSVSGQGGGSGASVFNVGVYVRGGVVTAGGSGTVTVIGTGGASTGVSNFGVNVFGSGSQVTSGGGNVSITGQGGGSGASNFNFGVSVQAGGVVTAGGSGNVSITGTGGASTGSANYGVLATGSGSKVTSGGGNVSVTGLEGAGPSGIGIVLQSAAAISTATNGGSITLVGNSMSLGGPVSAPSSSSVTLRPFTNGVGINLGSTSDPIGGPLSLSNAELNNITAGTINIGDANTGTITVSAAITQVASTNIVLTSGGDIVISGGQVNTGGGTLLLHPGATGSVKPTHAGTDATASTASFSLASALTINIAGTTVDIQYTQLNVAGAVDLSGVTLLLTGVYVPLPGDTFTIVSATSRTGTFAGLHDGATVTFNGVVMFVHYTATAVVLVDKANPTISTTASETSNVVGTAVLSESVTVSGGSNPTGTVTFTLTQPDNTTITVGSVPVNGDGTYNLSTTVTAAEVGTYTWHASYGGDGWNNGAIDDGTHESVATVKASPTISTSVIGSGGTLGSVTLKDSATLSGGYHESGTIAFKLYNPSGTLVDTETVTSNGDGTYTTATGYVPTVVGTYEWVVSFAGDRLNNGAATKSGDEPATVYTNGSNQAGSRGFWSNSQGRLVLTGSSSGNTLLLQFTALFTGGLANPSKPGYTVLVDANGNYIAASSFSSYSFVSGYLSGASATNMAYMLSAQLLATEFNNVAGYVNPNKTIAIANVGGETKADQAALKSPPSHPGVSPIGSFATIQQVINDTIAELIAAPNTIASTLDRTFEEALMNIFVAINQNGNIFV